MDLKEMLGEELYSQVVDKLGDKKLMVDDGNFIPKSRFDEVNVQKKELKEQVDTLNKNLLENNKALESLKKSAETSEELKKQIQEYQDKMNNVQKDFETQLTSKEQEWQQRDINNRKAFAMREKLLLEHADPNYIDLLMKEVDLAKISEDNGKFIGIDDVVTGVKSNFKKLFGEPVVKGTGLQGGTGTNRPANLEELYKKAMNTRSQADIEAYSKAKLQAKNKEE